MHQRRQGDGAAGAGDFLQVDLEADHEEQKDEAEFRDRPDALGRCDQARPGRPEGEAADEIGEEDRLPELLRDQPEQPGGGDAESNVANEFVHESVKEGDAQRADCS